MVQASLWGRRLHPVSSHNYIPAPPSIVEKTKRIETVCRRYEVSLKAAALQFPLRNSIVTSVISGPVTAAQAAENARLLDIEIADCFWEELKAEHLLHPDA